MPAVTVDDILLVPELDRPDPLTAHGRPVRYVTTSPHGHEGEGFPVRRAFAGARPEDLDPFIHMDEMGEVDYAPGEPKGTPWHPHRGFETVTYMIDGTFQHRDSMGGGGLITDGDTQWMTAGAGILHIERPPEELVASGGLFHGVQLWVNLPAAKKWTDPRYQDIGHANVKLLRTPDGGALLRLIAGTLGSFEGPGSTHTPITVVHTSIEPGATAEIAWPSHQNAVAYVFSGKGSVGVEARPIEAGQLAVFGAGDFVSFHADAQQESRYPKLEVLILGGEPINEPVARYGPFVMNTEEEIRQAFDDFQRGKMGQIPAGA